VIAWLKRLATKKWLVIPLLLSGLVGLWRWLRRLPPSSRPRPDRHTLDPDSADDARDDVREKAEDERDRIRHESAEKKEEIDKWLDGL